MELYAAAEVDAISLGTLTHSVRALDLSQRIV
jgi:nicotinate-nucleotide pyrophosphorylase